MSDKSSVIEFKTDRIVCVDLDNLHLFGEVIDTIAVSSRYWVRPLTIAKSTPESFKLEFLHDLRETAQLILPTNLFRDALDTEVLPLISELFHPTKDSEKAVNAQRVLYQFITSIYRSHRHDCRSTDTL
ncbi:hypothetical protein [Chamaesiphon sp. VAR_69_metabat_338]|uniref:hypothetical protein n=1 Tax=Chamaesiphon sp. VAR_69_metabat_338 TaxID=2964704 RepID=UPI00286E20CF|nr:hypothetical protein [Chamaesiphon sp. VAR_69_metabat_338]